MTINLKGMSRKELEKLQADVAKALQSAADKERTDALKAAQEAAAKYGYSLEELADTDGRKRRRGRGTRSKAAPKYRNPEDANQTWTGMGRQPKWFKEAVAGGTAPESMEI